MELNNLNTNTPPPELRSPKIDTSEVRKVSFWISQIFILSATIAGVYLAASQAFHQAVAYEKLMSDKSSYYLSLSLTDELTENVQLVKEYMNRIQKGGPAARKAPFQLERFVWDSMKFSSSTLEIPSPLLTGSRNFHRKVAEIQEKVSTLTYGVDRACNELQLLIDQMEKTTLPAFKTDTDQLKQHLIGNNIHVD